MRRQGAATPQPPSWETRVRPITTMFDDPSGAATARAGTVSPDRGLASARRSEIPILSVARQARRWRIALLHAPGCPAVCRHDRLQPRGLVP